MDTRLRKLLGRKSDNVTCYVDPRQVTLRKVMGLRLNKASTMSDQSAQVLSLLYQCFEPCMDITLCVRPTRDFGWE